ANSSAAYTGDVATTESAGTSASSQRQTSPSRSALSELRPGSGKEQRGPIAATQRVLAREGVYGCSDAAAREVTECPARLFRCSCDSTGSLRLRYRQRSYETTARTPYPKGVERGSDAERSEQPGPLRLQTNRRG